MGSLVVHNQTAIDTVTEIEVIKGTATVKKQSGLSIPVGQSSQPIGLPSGHYTVKVTVSGLGGTRTESHEIDIDEEGEASVQAGLPPVTDPVKPCLIQSGAKMP